MKHNDCFDDKDCDPIIIGACCDPKTVCPSNSQLQELQSILMDLTTAISTFLTTPNASTAPLIALFTKLSALLNSLIPTAEVDYLKQLIQSILAVLTSMTPNKAQLIVLLQQFYSALADYFFSIKACFAPSILRFLFNLLTQLIIVTSGPTRGGAIIPLSSGNTTALLGNIAVGAVSTGTLLGFGTGTTNISVVGNQITIPTVVGDYGFVVPRDGVITSLAGFFKETVGAVFTGVTERVQLQIFIAPAGSSTFIGQSPILLLDPAFTGGISIGDIAEGIVNMNIPVKEKDKILVYASLSNKALVALLTGFVSAGIAIS
ncbi:BclB domain-containing protein [Bacillus mycoides]|nr:BclB domain-containing protein [Bacillus mycoides]